ncbi:hypothetical protein J1605_019310 [Eschrichtius robustus]|uniref:TLDc domain-containing protein n=1 Tax=Eschrichtius robustus TaxID=9764 RepID=A0AB34HQY3_ESCRO|nr:hypothetical protein J1605_019310 [Eschrichtius robustus]
MAMTTCLTWMQEKKLQNHFGEKQFSLLYKASVHEFSSESLLQRCSKQGPIITVIHSEDHILGAYVPKSYPEDYFIILFAFQETTISHCKIGPFQLSMLFCESDRNSEFNINLEKKEVAISINTMDKLGLPQCYIAFQECEVFRCEDLLDKRRMDGLTELRESLLTAIRSYEPYGGRVRQVRILLLGPIGAGKSSFFNSVKSVFRGHVTNQALVGSKTTGVSEKYRTYFIKDGKDGNTLPFILCDSMGLSEKEEGLHMDDIPYILEGCIPDRYQAVFTLPAPVLSLRSDRSPSLSSQPRPPRRVSRQASRAGERCSAPSLCAGVSLLFPLRPCCCGIRVVSCGSRLSLKFV